MDQDLGCPYLRRWPNLEPAGCAARGQGANGSGPSASPEPDAEYVRRRGRRWARGASTGAVYWCAERTAQQVESKCQNHHLAGREVGFLLYGLVDRSSSERVPCLLLWSRKAVLGLEERVQRRVVSALGKEGKQSERACERGQGWTGQRCLRAERTD